MGRLEFPTRALRDASVPINCEVRCLGPDFWEGQLGGQVVPGRERGQLSTLEGDNLLDLRLLCLQLFSTEENPFRIIGTGSLEKSSRIGLGGGNLTDLLGTFVRCYGRKKLDAEKIGRSKKKDV